MDEVSVTIAAAPERVWALVTDIPNMGRWSPGCTGGRWTSGATGPAEGARFTGSNKHGLLRWSTHCTVIECEQPRRFAFQVRENKMRWGWKLEPAEGGGTVLTQWRDRTEAPSLPVRAAALLIFGGKVDETMVDGMRRTLDAVKADAEA
ncbi:SRPBCC family protein [Pseudonocardia acaciae]|uniref:SRPBCC family protein n=1 Tax=Pseudonocardia acaciae TaxID=551276 RepID=UPI00048C14F4|nr:SRPBCC family protein [Pseudonocardia acaciae]